jgi:hypothetical protein
MNEFLQRLKERKLVQLEIGHDFKEVMTQGQS